jgi:hypothetical protein
MGEPRIYRPDDLPHDMGVIDDHAGTQMILVVWLDGTNMAKERAI